MHVLKTEGTRCACFSHVESVPILIVIDIQINHSFSSKSKGTYLAVSRQAAAKRATLMSLLEVDILYIPREPTTNMCLIPDIGGVPFLIG